MAVDDSTRWRYSFVLRTPDGQKITFREAFDLLRELRLQLKQKGFMVLDFEVDDAD